MERLHTDLTPVFVLFQIKICKEKKIRAGIWPLFMHFMRIKVKIYTLKEHRIYDEKLKKFSFMVKCEVPLVPRIHSRRLVSVHFTSYASLNLNNTTEIFVVYELNSAKLY